MSACSRVSSSYKFDWAWVTHSPSIKFNCSKEGSNEYWLTGSGRSNSGGFSGASIFIWILGSFVNFCCCWSDNTERPATLPSLLLTNSKFSISGIIELICTSSKCSNMSFREWIIWSSPNFSGMGLCSVDRTPSILRSFFSLLHLWMVVSPAVPAPLLLPKDLSRPFLVAHARSVANLYWKTCRRYTS